MVPLLVLAVGEVVAGLTLRFNIDLLTAYPVLMIVIPGLMDLRGDVYGAIGYRLTTALHLGEVEPRFFTRFNLFNTLTGYVVSLIVSLELSILGAVLSYVFNMAMMDPVSLLFAVTASTIIVFAILNPVVTASTITLFKKGVDPSGFVAVVVTGVGDALTPFTLLSVSLMLGSLPQLVKAVFVVAVVASIGVAYTYLVRVRQERPVMENTASSIIAASGSSLGGFIAASSLGTLAKAPEVLGVLPAFNALIGASMGHIGNIMNIELHIRGRLSHREYRRRILVEAAATFTSVLAAYVVVLASGSGSTWAPSLMVVSSSFIIVYFLSAFTTMYLTLESFKHGWDPDNIVFPLMTTFADFNGYLVVSLILGFILGH